MKNGWIKLHRKLQDSDMYRNMTSKQRDVLIQCLLHANHEPHSWEWGSEIFKCNPGQFVTSIEKLCSRCANDVSIRNTRTALLKLEKWHFLTNTSTKTGRLITICNWDSYQEPELQTDKHIDKQVTNSRQTADKPLTTNKNDKELKEERKYIKEIDDSKMLQEKTKQLLKAFIREYQIIHNIPATESKQRIWLEKLLRLPAVIRHEAIARAIGGSWKDIHDFRTFNEPQALTIPNIDTTTRKERESQERSKQEEIEQQEYFASADYQEALEHQRKMKEALYEN